MAYGNGGKKVPGLRRRLGMTKRPTAAGQARFGDVDVTGAQISDQEVQRRARERQQRRALEAQVQAQAQPGLVGAQMSTSPQLMSGAQTTNQEHHRMMKMLAPRPGDSPSVLANKQRHRARTLAAMRRGR